MSQEESKTKAKAFAYLMDQIAWVGDDIKTAMGEVPKGGHRPARLDYWAWLFPSIGRSTHKRGHWQAQKDPAELARHLTERTEPVSLAATGQMYEAGNINPSDFALLLGWLVRHVQGPFVKPLIIGDFFASRFRLDTIERFLQLLEIDFPRTQPFLLSETRDSLETLLMTIAAAPSSMRRGLRCWPGTATDGNTEWTFGTYLARRRRDGSYKNDWRADLVVAMALCALLGPRDYRTELLIYPHNEATDAFQTRDSHEAARAHPHTTTPLGLERTAHITRVTFDADPPDERDWVICDYSAGGTAYPAQFMSVSLADATRVIMARDIERFSAGNTIKIPLHCSAASPGKHIEMLLTDGSWVLTDMGSDNGTLIVSQDGRRQILHSRHGEPRRSVLLQNHDVICIAPDARTGRACPTHPAFLFHTSTADWY